MSRMVVAVLLAVASGAAGAPIAAQQPAPVYPAVALPGGITSSFLVAGDMNGDGLPDLVHAQKFFGTIAVQLSRESGGFAPEVVSASITYPGTLVLGDADVDGRLDVFVIDSIFLGGRTYLQFGDGQGGLGPPHDVLLGPYVAPVLADVDGDGLPDLVGRSASADAVQVRLAIAPGRFGKTVLHPAGGEPGGVEVADFDGDGLLDFVVCLPMAKAVAVLPGLGDADFGPPAIWPAGVAVSGLEVGEVTGDGVLDVVAIAIPGYPLSSMLVVLAGDGSGGLSTPVTIYSVSGDPQLHDLEGDGDLDVILPGSASVHLNDGVGGFGPVKSHSGGLIGATWGLADIDQDGLIDAVSNAGPSLVAPGARVVLWGDGEGGFETLHKVAGDIPAASIALGDFSGDGALDVATCHSATEKTAAVSFGDGQGSFGPAQTVLLEGTPQSVTAGDLNGDGFDDLVGCRTGALGGKVVVALADGAGSFLPGFKLGVGGGPRASRLLDVDGDADLDIVATVSNVDTVAVLRGDGAGAFAPQVSFAAGPRPLQLAHGDLDGDGNQDLVVLNTEPGLFGFSVLLGDGAGAFAPPATTPLAGEPQWASLGDAGGDGVLDLALVENGQLASIRQGDGSGGFATPGFVATWPSLRQLELADVNADGHADLLALLASWHRRVELRLGDGAGGFLPLFEHRLGVDDVSCFALGALDGQGEPDVVVAVETGSGSVRLCVLENLTGR
jgi:hypothetical protein